MTMSTYHVGVPVSSVDYVVYHWRQDRHEGVSQWPEKCYDYRITGYYYYLLLLYLFIYLKFIS